MRPKSLLFEELTREDAAAIAADTLVVLPVGATEQHGPHLPVGTDTFTVEYVARAAAAEVAQTIPIVVTPTLAFGSSHHHLIFGGTLSLSTETYYRVIYELTEALIISGFTKIFILNGHGGNTELVHLVARDITFKHNAHVAAGPYWSIAWDAVSAVAADMPGSLPGHAGVYETSQIMALRPELVNEPRPHRDVSAPYPNQPYLTYRGAHYGFWRDIDGYTDSPAHADAEQGRRYLAAVVSAVAKAFVTFYHESAR